MADLQERFEHDTCQYQYVHPIDGLIVCGKPGEWIDRQTRTRYCSEHASLDGEIKPGMKSLREYYDDLSP